MPCLIRRYHVPNIMVFLIVMMILVNVVYAFLGVFLSRHPKIDSNSALYNKSQVKDAEVIVDDSMPSVRFIVNHNGSVRLVSPRALISTVETNSMVIAIMRKFHQMRLEPIAPVQGYIGFVNRIKRALSYSPSRKTQDPSFLWSRAGEWPFQLDNYKSKNMGDILRFTNKAEILEAKNIRSGTQLKVQVLLDGGQLAVFKPSWYPGGTVINGAVWGGKDRHFSEIAAFYLNQLLGYYNGPIAVGRRVNVATEIMVNAEDKLRNTFFRDPGGNFCFNGVCVSCRRNGPVCAHGENIDGALILFLNKTFHTMENPWQRTYTKNLYAEWQTEPGYCSSLLRNGSSLEFILDIVAVAIFDFLIGNGDRHKFEMYTDDADAQLSLPTHAKSMLLIDNGKGFGNPYEDYIDILSPLYQCCKIRQSLLRTLKKFNRVLGKALDSLSSFDPLYPLLDDRHLESIDRRLEIVFATVEVCLSRFNIEDVII